MLKLQLQYFGHLMQRVDSLEKILMLVEIGGRRRSIEACHKRPVTLEQMESVANEIELELQNSLTHEVPSSKIGVLVMERLKQLDEVAYVRFASVYREFKDLDTFMRELEDLKSQKNEK